MRRSALACALALGACVPAQGPLMRPGEDCMRCHGGGTVPGAAADGGFAAHHARPWTIAGSIYDALDADPNAGVLGAYVHVTDSSGWSFELRSNLAGNFYSAERVAFPLQVCVERGGSLLCAQSPHEYGSCNACHAQPPIDGAAGRLVAP